MKDKVLKSFQVAVSGLAVALIFVAALCTPPTAHAATPSNTYCSTDSGVTWLPCNASALPTGGATAANQTSTQSPVAPATATATKSELAGCQYNSTAPTFTDGQQGRVGCGARGGVNVLQVDANGTAVDPTAPVQTYGSDSFVNITTKTNTQVKNGAGTFTRILISSGTTDTLQAYDNTACSGTVIWGPVNVPATSLLSIMVGATFSNGLCVTSGGGTAGVYAVIYR